MTFQSNIPNPGDLISKSQNDLLDNFIAIGTSWPVNHVDFNVAGDGKHKFVEMPNQTTPGPAGAGAQFAIYSLNDSGQSEIWYRRDAEADPPVQLTGKNPTVATLGRTFLPGGLLMQWGIKTSPINDTTIAFLASSFSIAPYSVTITGVRDDKNPSNRTIYVSDGTVTKDDFKVKTDSSSFKAVYWMAIGKA